MLNLIAAMDRNLCIGKAGVLPWNLPADLDRFKRITMGHPCIMGRGTYESLRSPLKGRTNIVVSSNSEWRYTTPSSVLTATSLDYALSLAKTYDEEVFVIGGDALYSAFMRRADRMYLTRIDAAVMGGDRFFPKWSRSDWQRTALRISEATEENPFRREYETWTRKRHD